MAEDFGLDQDCAITEDNRKDIVEQVIADVSDNGDEAAILTAYANVLLDGSDDWSKYELACCLASFLDGWTGGRNYQCWRCKVGRTVSLN